MFYVGESSEFEGVRNKGNEKIYIFGSKRGRKGRKCKTA